MNIPEIIAVYLVSVVVFFAIDMVWLGVVARSFYKNRLGELLGPVNWTAAIIFYLIFLVGLLIFATAPALDAGSLTHAMLFGALFGFFTYATYDLTNLATLKNWPLSVVFVDMLWGTVLSLSVASLTFLVAQQFIL